MLDFFVPAVSYFQLEGISFKSLLTCPFDAILTIMTPMKVIGLISGTSVDGIDAALVDIDGRGRDATLKLLRYETLPYPSGVPERILGLTTGGTIKELCHLNFYLGELFSEAAGKITKLAGYSLSEIDLIGSHGQTVYHYPKGKREKGRLIRSSLQIAEPSVIAERTGITTVADFRPRDIAAGGEGAPLTPRLHDMLFRHEHRSRVVINIGGISNLTYLQAGRRLDSLIAYDTGPGNMLIDGIVRLITRGRSRVDREGRLGGAGKVHQGLLANCLRDSYLRKTPPKTTGREAFGSERIEKIVKKGKKLRLSTEDLLATVTAFTARSISESYRKFILPRGGADEMIVGGGGTRNPTLMNFLSEAMIPTPVKAFEDYGLDSKAIEAMGFGFFAYETILGIPNNVPSATGAMGPVVMGKIIPGRTGVPYSKS